MKMLRSIQDLLIQPVMSKQGVHIDPGEIGDPSMTEWSKRQREMWFSTEMEMFRQCLRYDDLNLREAVLNDLACYHGISPEEARERCLHWEAWSVREWSSAARNSPEAIQAFYDSVESWTFDCLWYAYQQAMGHAYPASVIAARFALERAPQGAHLDFGSGVGLTSHLFQRLGFSSVMADVSPTLLKFARWRMARRGVDVPQIDLRTGTLPSGSYDIVTAIDSLFCAPNFDHAVSAIHRALKPGGWLLATFDVRAANTPETAWHLYHSVVELEHKLLIAGFKRISTPSFALPTYQRLELTSAEYLTRRRVLELSLPVRRFIEPARRVRWPTPSRMLRLARRLARRA